MNEFIEKLIKRLEEHSFSLVINWEKGKYLRKDKAIEIINELAEEYKGGWIPCSERLPDKELIYVIGCFKNGNVSMLLYQGGGIFENDYGTGLYNTKQVIAWQPLPDPYKEEKH